MKFPEYPRPGKLVEETVIEILNWIRANNVVGINGARGSESPNGKTFVIKTQEPAASGGSGTTPPLWPKLSTVEEAFIVNLSPGYINERIPGDAEALACQEISNLKWGTDAPEGKTADDLRDFPITVGQQISVLVYVDVTGQLGGDDAPDDGVAEIKIEAVDTESTHYVPPCGDDSDGSAGVYHYKIAVLRAADDTHSGPWLEMFLAGDHIDHFRDLPLLANHSDGSDPEIGRVVGEFDNATDEYKFRGVKGKFGLKAAEEETLINIDIDALNIGGASGVWKNPNGEVPEDGDTFGDEPFKLRTLRGLTTDEADAEGITPQLTVSLEDGESSDSGAKDTIRFRGNGKKGVRFEGTPLEIAWKDGFVTSEGTPDGGGALDIIIWGCSGDLSDSDPTLWDPMLLRMSFVGGILVGTNETFVDRPLATDRKFTFLQDCCFIDDPPQDDWRTP